MSNNDIIRRLRYALAFNDAKMIEIFQLGGLEISRDQLTDWLKKEEDEGFNSLVDLHFSSFLNGLITEKRGKKEGEDPKPEKSLNNNTIFRKLKIAFNLIDQDILDILLLADFQFSKHELSALFRKPNQEQFRPCKDQVLRNFLIGLQLKFRSEPKQKIG